MFIVKKINNLLELDISHIQAESKCEGFRFVHRLLTDYQNEFNTFSKPGEALYGVFTTTNTLIAIGGVNIDPFSKNPTVARLRRFYVLPAYRRMGVGSLLLEKIIGDAKENFSLLVLHTDTDQGDQFYTAYGFAKVKGQTNYTHQLKIGD